jgi:hypothetical protein
MVLMDHHGIMVLLLFHNIIIIMGEVFHHPWVHKHMDLLPVGDLLTQMIDVEMIEGKMYLVVDSV